MLSQSIKKVRWFEFLMGCTLIAAGVALAGGFQLAVEIPDSPADAPLKGAVLLIRTYGCNQPSDASLTGTAEGIVNGQRRSLPLQLTLTSTGVYAVKPQWPEGIWVLALRGLYNGHTSTALIEVGPDGKIAAKGRVVSGSQKSGAIRIIPRKPSAAEIDTALKTLAEKGGAKSTS